MADLGRLRRARVPLSAFVRTGALAALLLVTACTDETGSTDTQSAEAAPPVAGSDEPVTEPEPDDLAAEAEGACEPESSDGIEYTSAHAVVDGAIGPVCFGEPDETLQAAWAELAVIAPPDALDEITLFSGFEASGPEVDTLAYVTPLDLAGTEFEMAVNLPEADAAPEEMMLTMAHELSHVFNGTPDQLDRSAVEGCPTYFNGEGCYLPDSIMQQWIDEFWDAELLATVDPFTDDPDAADERCTFEPGFFGSYGATNPEEDFGEAFSAFVYAVEVDTAAQQAKLDWLADDPFLASFADRAAEAGRGPLANNFDPCG